MPEPSDEPTVHARRCQNDQVAGQNDGDPDGGVGHPVVVFKNCRQDQRYYRHQKCNVGRVLGTDAAD